MIGSTSSTKKALKILRSCERSRLQRALLEAAYELVTPTLRRTLAKSSADSQAARPRAQADTTYSARTGGNHS